MKYLTILLIGTLMTGCTTRVEGWELAKATEYCSDRGGISYLNLFVYKKNGLQ